MILYSSAFTILVDLPSLYVFDNNSPSFGSGYCLMEWVRVFPSPFYLRFFFLHACREDQAFVRFVKLEVLLYTRCDLIMYYVSHTHSSFENLNS